MNKKVNSNDKQKNSSLKYIVWCWSKAFALKHKDETNKEFEEWLNR